MIFTEDDPITSKVLRYLLTRNGFQGYNFTSGVGVLEGVKKYTRSNNSEHHDAG